MGTEASGGLSDIGTAVGPESSRGLDPSETREDDRRIRPQLGAGRWFLVVDHASSKLGRAALHLRNAVEVAERAARLLDPTAPEVRHARRNAADEYDDLSRIVVIVVGHVVDPQKQATCFGRRRIVIEANEKFGSLDAADQRPQRRILELRLRPRTARPFSRRTMECRRWTIAPRGPGTGGDRPARLPGRYRSTPASRERTP